ncbi:MAG: fused MFS/spermidine synthase [Candidatus Binatia bacterium]
MASALIFFLFFVSGALGLVYEILWIRKLGLIFGTTSFALSTVLAAFFGGLALGSLIFGRIADRSGNPVKIYAYLEVGIGLFALVFPSLLDLIESLNGLFYPSISHSFFLLTSVRFVLLAPVLLIPTTMMGGTLPLLSRYFVRAKTHLSLRVGSLYAVNTFGAVLGTFVCGFYAIYYIGVDATTYVAGVLNIGVGGAVWMIGQRLYRGDERDRGKRSKTKATVVETHPFSPGLVRLALICFGLSGFASMAYEVVWTRYLSLYLMNSIYAYTTILAVFLLGIALGSILFSRYFDKRQNLLEIFGYLQLGIGLSTVLLAPALFYLNARLENLTLDFFVLQILSSAALMLLPTTLMGATFPVVAKIVAVNVGDVGSYVGKAYAVNTLGAILGSVASGFLFLPLLGLQRSLMLLVGLNVCMACVGAFADPRARRKMNGAVFVLLAAGVLMLARDLYSQVRIPHSLLERLKAPSERILDVEEGLVNTVWVTVDDWERKSIWANRTVLGRTKRGTANDLSAQKIQGHIPMLLHPGEPREILGIAFGTGQTFGAQLLYDVERIDAVDISAAVVELAVKHFKAYNNDFASNPKARIIIDDGRNYVLLTRRSYDVITMELPPPEEAGIVNFYTREFYEAAKRRLKENGIISQWVPIYNTTPKELRGITRTFLTVFPDAMLWFNSKDLLLLGSKGPIRIDVRRLEKRLKQASVFEDLNISYLGNPEASLNRLEYFLGGFLMGPSELEKLSREGEIYTDNHPTLEFSFVEYPERGRMRRNLLTLENVKIIEKSLGSIEPLLTAAGGDFQDVLQEVSRIQRRYIKSLYADVYNDFGTIYRQQGLWDRAVAWFLEALRVMPDYGLAHYNLGVMYEDRGLVEKALSAYRKAVRAMPDVAEAHAKLGVVYQLKREWDEAIAAYRKAVQLKPEYAEAHYNLGHIYHQRQQWKEAIAAFEEVIRLKPEFYRAYGNLGLIYFRLGYKEKAVEMFREVVRLNPGDEFAKEALRRLAD